MDSNGSQLELTEISAVDALAIKEASFRIALSPLQRCRHRCTSRHALYARSHYTPALQGDQWVTEVLYASVKATEVIQEPVSSMAVLRQLSGEAQMKPLPMQGNACMLPHAREEVFSAALKHSRQLQSLPNQRHPHHRHSRCAGPLTPSNTSTRHLNIMTTFARLLRCRTSSSDRYA